MCRNEAMSTFRVPDLQLSKAESGYRSDFPNQLSSQISPG